MDQSAITKASASCPRRRETTTVIGSVEQVTGATLSVVVGPRRLGDPPELVAANDKIKRVLGWTPRHDELSDMVRTAWEWETHRPDIAAAAGLSAPETEGTG